MSITLTRAELEALTSYKQPARMQKWLDANGWVFQPQTLGEPCGYAILKPSRNGRPEISDDVVLQRVVDGKTPIGDEGLDAMDQWAADQGNPAYWRGVDEGVRGTAMRWDEALKAPMPRPGVMRDPLEGLYRRTEDIRQALERTRAAAPEGDVPRVNIAPDTRLLHLMGEHNFSIPNAAFDELSRMLKSVGQGPSWRKLAGKE